MAEYIVRIELHGIEDYQPLYTLLKHFFKCKKTIDILGKDYLLPRAVYYYESNNTNTEELCAEFVKKINEINKIKAKFDILLVNSNDYKSFGLEGADPNGNLFGWEMT
jgi:hypothetical protein